MGPAAAARLRPPAPPRAVDFPARVADNGIVVIGTLAQRSSARLAASPALPPAAAACAPAPACLGSRVLARRP